MINMPYRSLEDNNENEQENTTPPVVNEELASPGFKCSDTIFEENERAGSWLESPIFFRMGYHDFIKVNLLSYSLLNYKADQWYKVDFVLDWDESYAAFFIDGKFIANTWFYTRERDL